MNVELKSEIFERQFLPNPKLSLPENEGLPGMLPEITMDTVKDVISEFSAAPHRVTQANTLPNPTISFFRNAFEAGRNFLTSDIKTEGSPSFVYQEYSNFLTEYFQGFENCQGCFNGATGGFGFITKAFEHQIGPKFTQQFVGLLNFSDGEVKVKDAIHNSLSVKDRSYKYSERINWLARANPELKIPDYQMALEVGIRYMATKVPNAEEAIEDGAISAYRIIDTLWAPMQQYPIT